MKLLKKYRAFGIGLLSVTALAIILSTIGFIRFSPDMSENVLFLLLWWMLISIPIHYSKTVKKHKKPILKVLGTIGAFIALTIYDETARVPENSVTVVCTVILLLYLVYLILPSFFVKYRWVIFTIYGLAMAYFVNVRSFSGGLEAFLENHQEQAYMQFVLPIPLLISLWLYEQWRSIRALKSAKMHAELEMLTSQINPHFFFNTLNNLYSLTVSKSDQAPAVVLKLAEMMRYTIYEGKNEEVAIEKELAYLQHYIELQRIRYHQQVDISFEHDIDYHITVAPLLFIILLENAFKHGVEKMDSGAYIHLHLQASNDQVNFYIENNFENTGEATFTGIGLENLKRRLNLIYPNEHLLTLTQEDNIFKAALTIK